MEEKYPAKHNVKRRGRHMVVVMPNQLLEKLDYAAAAAFCSRSDLVRRVLVDFVTKG